MCVFKDMLVPDYRGRFFPIFGQEKLVPILER